jgi:peptide deformylase
MPNEIFLLGNKKEEKVLRKKAADFDFKKFNPKEIRDLVARMRRIMRAADGIGLSANQIGLDVNLFVAEIPDPDGGTKFYAVFNPAIEKIGDEKKLMEEGCLSVPGKYGDVERATRITITGLDKYGKPTRIKAWGLLAHVFQHEIDHLHGVIFIDKAKSIHGNEAMKEHEKSHA